MNPLRIAPPRRARAWPAAAAGLLFLLAGCTTPMSRVRSVYAERVDGVSYLILETVPLVEDTDGPASAFTIYRNPEPGRQPWSEVMRDRVGPVYGVCACRDAQGEALALFLQRRLMLARFRENGSQEQQFATPFDWLPETGAQVKDTLWVFGGELQSGRSGRRIALRAAAFDGKELKEVKLDPPVPLPHGRDGSFWLRAVAHGGRVHVFGRAAEYAGEMLWLDLDAPLTQHGPLLEAVYELEAGQLKLAAPVRERAGLPPGCTVAWSDGTQLHAAVQEQTPAYQSPPIQLFRLEPGGETLSDPLAAPAAGAGRLAPKYYLLEHVAGNGRGFLLRSNALTFEVWTPSPSGWQIAARPGGLPEHRVENLFAGLAAIVVAFLATGFGLAYRRRRMVRETEEPLVLNDVLAPLVVRGSAFLVDLLFIVACVELSARFLAGTPVAWSRALLAIPLAPEPAFLSFYLAYMVSAEWLTGRTLGKRLMGLCVVNLKGEPPSLWAVLARNVLGLAERQAALALLGAFPLMSLTPFRQRLGDFVGRTVVVHEPALRRYQAQHDGEARPLPASLSEKLRP